MRKRKQFFDELFKVVTRLTGFLQFGDERFSHAVVRNDVLVSRKAGSHGLHNGAGCILAHLDLFGRLPLPCWRREIAFTLSISSQGVVKLPRLYDAHWINFFL